MSWERFVPTAAPAARPRGMHEYGATCCRSWYRDRKPAFTITAPNEAEARRQALERYSERVGRVYVWRIKG